MQNRAQILTCEEITTRAEAIGVPLGRLATEAGLSPSTLYRWPEASPTLRTLRAVQQVLEARERVLLRSLMRLHAGEVEEPAA